MNDNHSNNDRPPAQEVADFAIGLALALVVVAVAVLIASLAVILLA